MNIIEWFLSLFKPKPKPVVTKSVTPTPKPVVTNGKQRIKDLEGIRQYEALRLKAYKPTPNDVWTIGYGHTSTTKPGMVITAVQAEALLRKDVAWVEDVIHRRVKVPLTQNQFDALGHLIFNIGEMQFAKSTVLRKLNEGDYQGAANAFLMWNKQRSKTTGKMIVLRGLTTRRQKERELFLRK